MTPPGDTPDSTSTSLLSRARLNDSRAWERVDLIYRPLVTQWVRRHFDERRSESEDIFRAWLRTITTNKITDARRRLRRQPQNSDLLSEVADDPPVDLSGDEVLEGISVLRRATAPMRTDFEERTWQAFWLTAVEDRDVEAVAVELGMSQQSVRTYRSRVLACLRAETRRPRTGSVTRLRLPSLLSRTRTRGSKTTDSLPVLKPEIVVSGQEQNSRY